LNAGDKKRHEAPRHKWDARGMSVAFFTHRFNDEEFGQQNGRISVLLLEKPTSGVGNYFVARIR